MARKTGSHADITGPRVRAAALKLIAQDGFAAVSMRQIAAEVGLQAGALYSYTADKQTLLLDLLLTAIADRQAAWDAVAPAGGDPLAWLEAFTAFHLEAVCKAPDVAALISLEQRNLMPENRAQVAAAETAYRAPLEAQLAAGAEAKSFAVPDAKLAAAAVLGLIEAAALAETRLTQDRVARITWNMVRRAVGAQGFQ